MSVLICVKEGGKDLERERESDLGDYEERLRGQEKDLEILTVTRTASNCSNSYASEQRQCVYVCV